PRHHPRRAGHAPGGRRGHRVSARRRPRIASRPRRTPRGAGRRPPGSRQVGAGAALDRGGRGRQLPPGRADRRHQSRLGTGAHRAGSVSRQPARRYRGRHLGRRGGARARDAADARDHAGRPDPRQPLEGAPSMTIDPHAISTLTQHGGRPVTVTLTVDDDAICYTGRLAGFEVTTIDPISWFADAPRRAHPGGFALGVRLTLDVDALSVAPAAPATAPVPRALIATLAAHLRWLRENFPYAAEQAPELPALAAAVAAAGAEEDADG